MKMRSGNRNGNMDLCENIFGIEMETWTGEKI
jgi:hypothetical protein